VAIDGGSNAPQGSDLLCTPAERDAIVRFSRSVGVPRPLPDLLGVSLRVLDAYGPERHQDVLMVSSVDLPIGHHLFVPAADFQQRPYTSSLPYRAGGRETFLLGVTPIAGSPRPAGDDEFERLDRAAVTGRLVFGFAVAPVAGRFRRVGSIRIGERLPQSLDALRFNPFNSGGGLEPSGVLNALRDYAYPLSQAAWARRRTGAQEDADTVLRGIARHDTTATRLPID